MSQKVNEALLILERHKILENPDIASNRQILLPIITAMTFAESSLFLASIRGKNRVKDLPKSFLLVDASAVHPEIISLFWNEILWSQRMDFFFETLLYTKYVSTNLGTVYYSGKVDIYDYAAVAIEHFIHETCHSFNEFHGRPMAIGPGWNEGSAIALAKYFRQGERINLAETVFGTILYYRDIGLKGYPRIISIGNTNDYDQKGKEFVYWLMQRDISGVNWFDSREVNNVFCKYWNPLNRNIPWEEWLIMADAATANWRQEKGISW